MARGLTIDQLKELNDKLKKEITIKVFFKEKEVTYTGVLSGVIMPGKGHHGEILLINRSLLGGVAVISPKLVSEWS